MAEERHPLSWLQRRTPTRQQKRSKRWTKLYVGMRFEGTCWVLTQGPWRKIKKHGSQAWVTVLCDEKHGGCGREFDRKLYNIIQGVSTGCIHCHQRRLREQRQGLSQGAVRAGA